MDDATKLRLGPTILEGTDVDGPELRHVPNRWRSNAMRSFAVNNDQRYFQLPAVCGRPFQELPYVERAQRLASDVRSRSLTPESLR